MNIPISWLKEAANIQDATPTLLEKLTDAGNAVDGLAKLGADITNVIVGKIISLERHPDADKLWVTQSAVNPDESEILQIVTGADNLKVGDYIPVAIDGATLVNGLKIKKTKMRGVESNGMLCSIGELGYTSADFPEASEEGIYVFPTPQPLGADARPIMGLLEEVADFDILSNRPDTNSVIGMAREAAAVYNQAFSLPEIKLKESAGGDASDYVTVDIQDTARCPRYIARVVKNVKIGPSPQWMRRRLSTAGVRPINNIVDITNYVMLEYGQPLHAFDINAVAAKDGKHGIIVRTARAGETFTTLDGTPRQLSETHLLIADHEKPIGIAGVMGGENSMILDTTATILFESANFDSANIRQTSRSLGMRTDASARYEKGQDPHQALTSINRAMELVEILNCGEVVPGMVDVFPQPANQRKINYDPARINELLGTQLTPDEINNYLSRVGISTRQEGGEYEAEIPTFRNDITGAADLAEEVARFYGLNNIQPRYSQVLSGQTSPTHDGSGLPYEAGKPPRRRREDNFKRAAVALGYSEALTYPFESPKVMDKLLIPQENNLRTNAVHLKNPLGEDFSVMRTLPVAGLLESLARNYNKGSKTTRLFELACTYSMTEAAPREQQWLTLTAYGKDMDFLSIKGDAETLFATITDKPAIFSRDGDIPGFFHPGRSAAMAVKTSPNPKDTTVQFLCYIGEVHPAVAKNYGLDTRVYVAMLDISAWHHVAQSRVFKYVSPPVFPPIDRDLAFKVKEDIPAADIEAAIRERGGQILSSVQLFDVYQGEQVGEGYKSVAYSLRFRDQNRTLTVDDVQKPIKAILDNLEKKLGAEIR